MIPEFIYWAHTKLSQQTAYTEEQRRWTKQVNYRLSVYAYIYIPIKLNFLRLVRYIKKN